MVEREFASEGTKEEDWFDFHFRSQDLADALERLGVSIPPRKSQRIERFVAVASDLVENRAWSLEDCLESFRGESLELAHAKLGRVAGTGGIVAELADEWDATSEGRRETCIAAVAKEIGGDQEDIHTSGDDFEAEDSSLADRPMVDESMLDSVADFKSPLRIGLLTVLLLGVAGVLVIVLLGSTIAQVRSLKQINSGRSLAMPRLKRS